MFQNCTEFCNYLKFTTGVKISTNNSIVNATSLSCNDFFLDFGLSIIEFVNLAHWTSLPRVCDCISPHYHGSTLICIFSLLSTSNWASSKELANSVSHGISSWLRAGYVHVCGPEKFNNLRLKWAYPASFPTSWIYLKSFFFGSFHKSLGMKLTVIIEYNELVSMFETMRKDFALNGAGHLSPHWLQTRRIIRV